jgi:predicted nucleic acid-binding OB-fold protein
VCLHGHEHLEPYRKSLDYILYGGPRLTIERLRKLCPFLSSLGVPELPLMEVPPLRQYVLESSVTRMWSSRVIRWQEK